MSELIILAIEMKLISFVVACEALGIPHNDARRLYKHIREMAKDELDSQLKKHQTNAAFAALETADAAMLD
jgi:hypothetical protein